MDKVKNNIFNIDANWKDISFSTLEEDENETSTSSNLKLEEYLEKTDDTSQVDKNKFNLKLENTYFLYKNKDKLIEAGYTEDEINETISENDINYNVSEFWDEMSKKDIKSSTLSDIEKEYLQKTQKTTTNPFSTGETVGKESAQTNVSSKYKSIDEKLNNTKNNIFASDGSVHLNLSAEEQAIIENKKADDEKNEAELTASVTGGITKINKKNAKSAGTKAIASFKTESANGQATANKLCSNIDSNNTTIQENVSKITKTKEKAQDKMKKATTKSKQMTQKANRAMQKVGLKSIKGKKDKKSSDTSNQSKQNTTNDNTTQTNTSNTSTGNTNISKEASNTQQILTANTTANSDTQKTRLVSQDENIAVKQTNVKLLQQNLANQAQSTKANDEAKEIGKNIQSKSTKSINTTEKAAEKVENKCEDITTKTETYTEEVPKYKHKKKKDNGKLTCGIIGTVSGIGLIMDGMANLGYGFGAAEICIGIALGIVGICGINQGNKGHHRTVEDGTETVTRTRETQCEAAETQKSAESDIKQADNIEKENTKQEKEIDEILKENEDKQKEQEKTQSV